jgi:hypothetical protein
VRRGRDLDPAPVVPHAGRSSQLDPAPQPRRPSGAERTGVDGGAKRTGGSGGSRLGRCGPIAAAAVPPVDLPQLAGAGGLVWMRGRRRRVDGWPAPAQAACLRDRRSGRRGRLSLGARGYCAGARSG